MKELKNYAIDIRPWGGFEQFTKNEKTTVKILTLKPKQRFSLQKHTSREEFWKVLDNSIKITLGNKTFTAKQGDEIIIPKNTLHRAQNISTKSEANILEISFGNFKENDIKRLEDDYNRK